MEGSLAGDAVRYDGTARGVAAGGVSKALSCSKLSSMRLILSAKRGILHHALSVDFLAVQYKSAIALLSSTSGTLRLLDNQISAKRRKLPHLSKIMNFISQKCDLNVMAMHNKAAVCLLVRRERLHSSPVKQDLRFGQQEMQGQKLEGRDSQIDCSSSAAFLRCL